MNEGNIGPEFLQQKYQLNKDTGVVATANRLEKRTGEVVDQSDFGIRIQNYLNRLENIINPPQSKGGDHFDKKARNLSMIKQALYRNFVTTPEDIPEGYYDSIKRRHKEKGHGDIEIPEDYRQELAQTVREDQKESLDLWVDYLASDDAKYPDWLKYFAFRSVLRMGNYDKSKGVFNERTKGKKTTAPFAELNREALAIVLGDLEKKYSNNKSKPDNRERADFEFTSRFDISEDAKQKYLTGLDNKNFSQLYALAIEEFKPIAEGLLKNTEGRWVTYPRGSAPKQLVSSLANYGTGWCLRGEAMAEWYLVRDQNDLHIYYSKDQEGNSVVPRVVMVINPNGNITEVRGVATQEHLDPYIGEVVDAKLSEPEFEKEGKSYKKKTADMKTLTVIDKKMKTGQGLTGPDLAFLYEIDSHIEGFGYNKDPRITELRSQRNPEQDMPVVFGCSIDQIARRVGEINPDTKAYVGPLETGIFDKLPQSMDHIYTSFPEGKIKRQGVEIGGKSTGHLKDELKKAGINISSYVEVMLNSPDFTIFEDPQTLDTVRATVQGMGLKGPSTTDQVYARAKELGWDRCPPETGVCLRLQDKDQLLGNWYYIDMNPIVGRDGHPHVFGLGYNEDGLWLRGIWASPGIEWNPRSEFVFSLRKSET